MGARLWAAAHLLIDLLLEAAAEVLAAHPNGVHVRQVLVDGPLPAQIERLRVAKRVGDNVVLKELGALDEARDVSEDDVQVGVAPVRIVDEILGEDGAKGGLVLGDEPRPLGQHEAQPADEGRDILLRQAQLRPHAARDEGRDAAR